jgi:hypothetical protein
MVHQKVVFLSVWISDIPPRHRLDGHYDPLRKKLSDSIANIVPNVCFLAE